MLAGRPIVEAAGGRVATLKDFVARLDTDTYPPLTGMVARTGRRDFFVPIAQVEQLDERGAKLNTSRLNLQPFERRDGEVLLEHDILDHQLIDVEGRKVVRANDVALLRSGDVWIVNGVDVGHWALIRRIAPAGVVKNVAPELLDWKRLETFASGVPEVHLAASHDKTARLHPAEIARIVESVSFPQASEIVASLDDETAAETLEELDEQLQADIVKHMDEARAADVLEEMAPDDAADLLADLPPEKADALLEEMEFSESEDVQRLLTYPEDSAGGMMTTEFVRLPQNLTTREAVEAIRADLDKSELLSLFVLDSQENQQLVGAVTLRDLLLAKPDDLLSAYARADVQAAAPDMPADDVAQLMVEYNLLALPVVDEQRRILGVVTLDDAMDVVLPEQMRGHMPRLFR
jgi:CBS domain-containing protein